MRYGRLLCSGTHVMIWGCKCWNICRAAHSLWLSFNAMRPCMHNIRWVRKDNASYWAYKYTTSISIVDAPALRITKSIYFHGYVKTRGPHPFQHRLVDRARFMIQPHSISNFKRFVIVEFCDYFIEILVGKYNFALISRIWCAASWSFFFLQKTVAQKRQCGWRKSTKKEQIVRHC